MTENNEIQKCSYCGDDWEIYEDWKFMISTFYFDSDDEGEYACCLQCLRMLIWNILPKTHQNSDYFRLKSICSNSEFEQEVYSLRGLKNVFNQIYLEVSPDSPRQKIINEEELNNYHKILILEIELRKKLSKMEDMK